MSGFLGMYNTIFLILSDVSLEQLQSREGGYSIIVVELISDKAM
jgi:hypothetical protein